MNITKTKLLVIAALAIAGLVAIAGTVWVVQKRKQGPMTLEQAYWRGRACIDRHKYADAYSFFNHAVKLAPQDPKYNWEAAQAALALRQKSLALPHLQVAWDSGMKTREVLEARLECTTFRTPEDGLKASLEWLGEMAETDERREMEGSLQFRAGKHEEALRIWSALYGKAPSGRLSGRIALTHVTLKQPDKAEALLNPLRGTPHLDEEGYVLLGVLFAQRDAIADADAVLKEGRERFPQGERLRLQQAVYFLEQGREKEAAGLLDAMKSRSQKPDEEELRHQARIYLALALAQASDAAGLEALLALAAGDAPWLEGERLFYTVLRASLRGEHPSPDDLTRARTLLRGHPAVEWAAARGHSNAGRWAHAVTGYRSIEGLLSLSPAVQLELARALRNAGKIDEAFTTVKRLHGRRYYSKPSLELHRDLALEKGLMAEVAEAQAFLRKEYKDDPGVLFAGGLLAMRTGNLVEAAAVFEDLARKHPGKEDVELARLTVLLAAKDFEGLLRACPSNPASASAKAPLQAAALIGLGRREEAERLYDALIREKADPALLVASGNLLLSSGKHDEAGRRYSEALRQEPGNAVAHLGLAALAADRSLWADAKGHAEAAIRSDGSIAFAHLILGESEMAAGRPREALPACERALALDSRSLRGRFLQGLVFQALGRYDDAEVALKKCAADRPDSATFRWHLAKLYLTKSEPARALALIDESLKAKSTDEGTFLGLRMIALAQANRHDEARETLKRISPSMTPAKILICESWLLERAAKPAEALSILRGKLDDPDVAFRWAQLTVEQGGEQGVVEALDPHPVDAPRLAELAEGAREKGLRALESALYRRALRRDPDNAIYLNNFAWALIQLPVFDKAEALDAARKALTKMPDHPSLLHTAATVMLRCGQEAEAVALLEKGSQVVGRSAKLLLVRAQAYEKTGNRDKALQSYMACAAHPETTEVKEGELSRPELQKRIDALKSDGKPRQ